MNNDLFLAAREIAKVDASIGLNLAVSLFLLAPIYFIILILILVVLYSKSRKKHSWFEEEESFEEQPEVKPDYEEIKDETILEEKVAEEVRVVSSNEDQARGVERELIRVLSDIESSDRPSTSGLRNLLETLSQELASRSMRELKKEESPVQSRMESRLGQIEMESNTSLEQSELTESTIEQQQSESSESVPVEHPVAELPETPASEPVTEQEEQPEVTPREKTVAWAETEVESKESQAEIERPKSAKHSARSREQLLEKHRARSGTESGQQSQSGKSDSVDMCIEDFERPEVWTIAVVDESEISGSGDGSSDDSIATSELFRPLTAPPGVEQFDVLHDS